MTHVTGRIRTTRRTSPKSTITGPKKFGAEKDVGSENLVVVVLVILVTWTPNPLNSAKSP